LFGALADRKAVAPTKFIFGAVGVGTNDGGPEGPSDMHSPICGPGAIFYFHAKILTSSQIVFFGWL